MGRILAVPMSDISNTVHKTEPVTRHKVEPLHMLAANTRDAVKSHGLLTTMS